MARVEVRLPSLLDAVWDGGQSFSIQTDSVRAALDAIAEQHPRLAIHFFDESGALRPHVLCFWNGARTVNRSQWHIARDVLVAPTAQEARERANEVLVHNYHTHQQPNRQASLLAGSKNDPDMPDDAIDVEYLMDNVWIVGDPQECADKIRSIYGEVGGFGTLLTVTQDPDNHHWQHECLELLKNDVGPRIADLG